MYCRHCGKKIDENSKFCTECGKNSSIKKDDQENEPFGGPVSQEKDEPIDKKRINLEPASQGKRFLNFLLDWGFGYLFAFIIGVFLGVTGLSGLIENLNETVLGLLVLTAYYLIFEGIFNKSLAKFITRTRVINKDGSKPTLLTIFWRTLARFIPFEPFSFFGGNKPIGWHDSLSKTLVVDDK